MKRLILILLPVALVTGCGAYVPVPQEDSAVDVGYEKQSKQGLTTAVSKLKKKENEVVTYNNIYDYLQGRVAGVQVTPDKRILIRGINSINSSTDPLILVDGTEMSDISSLNPNDIESVSVLKDASSAIYGVRGGNGVILITTKH